MSAFSKFHNRPNSYPIAFRKEPHGQYQLFQRPSDFMLKYSPGIKDIAHIEPSYVIGKFPDLDTAIRTSDTHDGQILAGRDETL